MNPDTYFASPERSSDPDINSGNALLAEEKSILDVLGAISGIAAILNQNRQIVYANEEFIGFTGLVSLENILGKRPGEAISCIHSENEMAGCGTSKACSVCGAVNAILESQRLGSRTERETGITTISDGKIKSWDLRVTSAPVVIREMTFYVFAVQDISNEKRRQNLERTFFHDILNSAGNLNGLLSLLKEGADPLETRELINISEEVSRELIEEIVLHRQIRDAESGDLIVRFENLVASDMLRSAVSRIEAHEVAKKKSVFITDHASSAMVRTDRLLLQRILVNLLKNALEATSENGTVWSEAEEKNGFVRYSIKNDYVIPADVQMRIFQRSFSTRGKGRGIGTYSIKLLGEKYLGGKVDFTSSEAEGTIFYFDLPLA
jgi:signal transduction histidine kinase